MFRLVPFLVFYLLVSAAYAQGGDIDDALKSIDPGDRRTMKADFLSEKDGSEFDPRDELDSVTSYRIQKKITETEKAKKDHTSRMAKECTCALFGIAPYPFGNLCLEAVPKNDTRTQAQIEADKKRGERAWEQKKSLCIRWWRDKEAGRGAYEIELNALEAELERERALEERLRRQRIVDEDRKRAARIAAAEAERERLRQEAAARRQELEARKLDGCRAQWDKGRNPCGCGHLPEAPEWVKSATTCEK